MSALCDVEILLESGGGFRAHAAVLHARLPELLQGNGEATVRPIVVRVHEPASTVQCALEWAYADEISERDMSWTAFRSLLDCARRLHLTRFQVRRILCPRASPAHGNSN